MTRYNGTSGDDVFGGNGDNDVLYGLAGNDGLYGFGGADVLYGGPDNDRLYGGDGRDTLNGGEGADRLYGNAGADELIGGPGSDRYNGGDGRDTFVFTDVVRGAGATTEYVEDFNFGDFLDLSRIDANHNIAGNQAFRWLGEGDFTGRGGEIVYRFAGEGTGEYTTLYLDVDGNKEWDMSIVLDGGWFGIRPTDDYIML